MSFIYEKDLPAYLLNNYGLKASKKYLEKLRSKGQGPIFRKWANSTIYDLHDVEQWVSDKTASSYTYTQAVYSN